MPVVNVGNAQHPAYLPLSACLVIAQPSKLTLSSDETAIMQRFAVRVPCHNADSISNRGFSTLGLTNNPKLVKLPSFHRARHDQDDTNVDRQDLA